MTALETIGGTNKDRWVRVFTAVSLFVIIVIVGTSCTSPPYFQGQTQQSEIPVQVRFLAAGELKDWIDGGKVFLLVDTRRPEEYARDHIPTAVNVPFAPLAVARMELEEAGWDDPVVFYCNDPPTCKAHPCTTVIARMLISGARQVYLFKDGMKAWRALGYPVISPSDDPSRHGASRA